MSDKTKSYCNGCKRETNHEILAKHGHSDHDEKYGISWWIDYEMLECQGCDTVSFRTVHANSEDIDYETGKPYASIEIFPEPAKGREPISDSDEFPPLTRRVYLETLAALTSNAPILAAIGIRAIIESVCKDLNTGKKNLQENIDELANLGHLSTAQAEMLHKHRFMGNVAAHEIQPPKPAHLIVALDITETLLKTIYVLPKLAATLETPPSLPQAQQGAAPNP